MRIYLNCPYESRHIAKQHGARWDAVGKKWYYEGAKLPDALEQFNKPIERKIDLERSSNICPITDENTWECDCRGCRAWRAS